MQECEGVVDRGMVLVSTDAAAVEGDDDVNVVRHHVLLMNDGCWRLGSLLVLLAMTKLYQLSNSNDYIFLALSI